MISAPSYPPLIVLTPKNSQGFLEDLPDFTSVNNLGKVEQSVNLINSLPLIQILISFQSYMKSVFIYRIKHWEDIENQFQSYFLRSKFIKINEYMNNNLKRGEYVIEVI